MGVLRIAKQGFDVIKNNKERNLPKNTETPVRMYLPMMMIFSKGAKKQIQRYNELTALDKKVRNPDVLMECLHEIFTMFEDLSTLGKYIQKCGDDTKKEQHNLWLLVRNHIKHDIREAFDREDNEKKNKAARKLKLDPRFQMDMECAADFIRLGGTTVTIKEINDYLKWADIFIENIKKEAVKNGFLRIE